MAGHRGRTTGRTNPGPVRRRSSRSRLSPVLVACLLSITPAGCMGVDARDARLRNAVEDGWERFEASRSLDLSPEACAVLGRQRLLIEAQEDPVRAARLLESRLQAQAESDGAIALAELSYHVGLDSQKRTPGVALAWYRDAAIVASLAIGDPATSRPNLAVDIHNRSVARLIRLAQTNRVCDGGNRSWRQVLEAQGLAVHSSTMYLAPERIGDLRVASDFRVEGMDHVYRSSGLGVPLIAHRFTDESRSPDAQDLRASRAHRAHQRRPADPQGRKNVRRR